MTTTTAPALPEYLAEAVALYGEPTLGALPVRLPATFVGPVKAWTLALLDTLPTPPSDEVLRGRQRVGIASRIHAVWPSLMTGRGTPRGLLGDATHSEWAALSPAERLTRAHAVAHAETVEARLANLARAERQQAEAAERQAARQTVAGALAALASAPASPAPEPAGPEYAAGSWVVACYVCGTFVPASGYRPALVRCPACAPRRRQRPAAEDLDA